MRYFATTPKGLEPVLAAELAGLGASDIAPDRGGVSFSGDLAVALRANLELRSAMRVLESLTEGFPAGDARSLYEAARGVAWHERITPEATFAVEAHGKSAGLIHSHFTAQKVKDAVADEIRDEKGRRPSVDPKDPDVRIVAHIKDNRGALYLDLSGESLHRRGYRVQQTEAPLKESIAAALLLWAGYTGEKPLADPMCGSGTFAIEAALIAMGRGPNAFRRLGVERWPTFGDKERALLRSLREAARGKERPPAEIRASDIDESALNAARRNAAVAGVAKFIHFARADARQLGPLSPPGLVVFNPPYGERLGDDKTLVPLYREVGQRLRTLGNHEAVVLYGNKAFSKAVGMFPKAELKVFNGPIECAVSRYEIWDVPRR
jgi:23S rRNA (guanine2445-N2)-methyltransferase / 23S rRNA (guanine2069-N7)-methyltransferase